MARILFVDDHEQSHEYVRRACELMGYECAIFLDAADAWEHLQREDTPYDLIISDNDMPAMQGSEFLTLVREHAVHDKTSFTLMTGSDDPTLPQLCKEYNARFEDKGKLRPWREIINEGLAA